MFENVFFQTRQHLVGLMPAYAGENTGNLQALLVQPAENQLTVTAFPSSSRRDGVAQEGDFLTLGHGNLTRRLSLGLQRE